MDDTSGVGTQFTFLHDLAFQCLTTIWVMGRHFAMPDRPDKLPDPAAGLIISGNRPHDQFLAINLDLDPAVIMNVVIYLSAPPELQMQPGFSFSMANAELIGAWQRPCWKCTSGREKSR